CSFRLARCPAVLGCDRQRLGALSELTAPDEENAEHLGGGCGLAGLAAQRDRFVVFTVELDGQLGAFDEPARSFRRALAASLVALLSYGCDDLAVVAEDFLPL